MKVDYSYRNQYLAGSKELDAREQKNGELKEIKKMLEYLGEIDNYCRTRQLWPGESIGTIRQQLEDEQAREEES